jgi:hypothetical protein
LFGYRPVSQFEVELANRFVDDPCFDFVDHVASNFVSAGTHPNEIERFDFRNPEQAS